MSATAPSMLQAPSTGRLQVAQANLYYKTDSNKKEWTRLAFTSFSNEWNVYAVDFKMNSIKLTQKFRDGAGTCTVELTPANYAHDDIGIVMDIESGEDPADFWLEITILSSPGCTFSRTKKGTADPHTLDDFPLHRILPSIRLLQLRMAQRLFKPSNSQDVIRTQLSTLTMGSFSRLPGSEEQAYISTLMEGQLAEHEAAAASLRTLERCRIKSTLKGSKIWVEIWPNALADKIDDDIVEKATSLSYQLKDSKLFKDDLDTLREHPCLRKFGSTGWQVSLENTKSGSDAPIVGTIDNVFSPTNYQPFIGEDYNVVLEPQLNDVGGDRGRAALKDFAQLCDDYKRDLAGYFKQESRQSKLPLREMFLPGIEFGTADNNLRDSTPVPAVWRSHTNETQCNAIEMACLKKISIIWGPAATGKSHTVAHLICKLHLDAPNAERTLVTAPTNVAVDLLCDRLVNVWPDRMSKDTKMDIVRVFSEAEIERQYRARDANLTEQVYEKPTHIDAKRLAIASANPTAWKPYLEGRKKMIDRGGMNDKEQYKSYRQKLSQLTEMVLAKALVVFATCTSIRSKSLTRKVKSINSAGQKEKKLIWWGATTCIVDEAGCANPLQILSPLVTYNDTLTRFVMAGDHKQLPAYKSSETAKKVWTASFLHDSVEKKKIDHTILQEEYRSHDRLNAAANEIIYGGKVRSFHLTETPRPYLADLLGKLPMAIHADGRDYKLTSYMNFIDVEYGVHQTKPKGSSCNDAEVKVVEGLVTALLAHGKPLESMAVITGYLWQKEKLENMTKANQWSGLKILSADTCQGEEWDVVIISLVKTVDPPGFIGEEPRANVITTRAREARYYVGNWTKFWGRSPDQRLSGYEVMHKLLRHQNFHHDTKSFVVQAS